MDKSMSFQGNFIPPITTVSVFGNYQGLHGNKLTVINDKYEKLKASQRLELATTAGTSETVFVGSGNCIQIFTPTSHIPFAGYPCLGVAWLSSSEPNHTGVLVTDAGEVPYVCTGNTASITADPTWCIPWNLIQATSVGDVMSAGSEGENRHDYIWAWENKSSGEVYARAFTSASGVTEDSASGSAAMALAAQVGRHLNIRQGNGAILSATPEGERIRLSGRVSLSSGLEWLWNHQ